MSFVFVNFPSFPTSHFSFFPFISFTTFLLHFHRFTSSVCAMSPSFPLEIGIVWWKNEIFSQTIVVVQKKMNDWRTNGLEKNESFLKTKKKIDLKSFKRTWKNDSICWTNFPKYLEKTVLFILSERFCGTNFFNNKRSLLNERFFK